MTRYILDTDHLSLIQRGHARVIAKLRQTDPARLSITIITAEEQLRGRFLQIRKFPTGENCVIAYRQLRETIADLNELTVLDFDATAESVDQTMRKQFPRMDTRDRRIAAIALTHGAVLLTRNAKDFGQIPDLLIEDWTQ